MRIKVLSAVEMSIRSYKNISASAVHTVDETSYNYWRTTFLIQREILWALSLWHPITWNIGNRLEWIVGKLFFIIIQSIFGLLLTSRLRLCRCFCHDDYPANQCSYFMVREVVLSRLKFILQTWLTNNLFSKSSRSEICSFLSFMGLQSCHFQLDAPHRNALLDVLNFLIWDVFYFYKL